ncbi:unnamed protein product [Brachionus calyciflorus]|uniref:Uncharacterized protein n=1 Tax=Brachionus calyciflorus TaxID=104777 RepID=A0A813PR33_9BILA|nr:unnamed protein product [Brachionus calyciflorus]
MNSFEGPEFGVGDFVLLDNINIDEFMKNLKLRFDKNKIYTYIGEVVVSVNPYKQLDIYGQEYVRQYKGREIFERPPHIFAIAESAYKVMKRQVKDSCIVISGESGSGKTEASKIILKYISEVTNLSGKQDIEKVKNILLQSNNILECFGNARTNRNDNSSRFGKYMDIAFDFKGDPVGGRLVNYLLEKSRVVYQQKGERNFHSFYYLLYGASESELNEYNLKASDFKKYSFINQGGDKISNGMDDKQNFRLVNEAMKISNFDKSLIKTIWSIVASVVHLGNLKFESNERDLNNNPVNGSKHSEAKLTDECLKEIKIVSKLLKLDEKDLIKALTTRLIASGSRELVTTHHSVLEANYARDALAKALYEQLFSFIFMKINEILDVKNTVHATGLKETVIGILDIYGFEIFDTNGFEQFCINYCNEKLQQLFIELVLKQEQEEYQRENINWQHIDYFNNKIICDLVELPHKGIIAILDEASYNVGKINDEVCLEHMSKQLKDHKHFSSRDTNLGDKSLAHKIEFKINHYAGDVKYNIKGFIDKNKDSLYQDFKRLLYNSKDSNLKLMWPEGAQSQHEITKRPMTVATRFKNSIIGLVQNLSTKDPFYVRCIKPNETKTPTNFDYEKVKSQVFYLGLIENVRVRRAGFAYRLTYEKFLQRYKCICSKTWPNPRSGLPKDNVNLIIREFRFDNDVKNGLTKIFIKSPKTVFELENKRAEAIPKIVVFLQKLWRGTLARRYYARLKAANKICLYYKKYKARNYINQLFKLYGNAKQKKDYGKSVQWPMCKNSLKKANSLVKKIYIRWRAYMILKPYPPNIRSEIYLLSLSYELIKNRPIMSNQAQKWKGDYLSDAKENNKAIQYKNSIADLKQKDNFNRVLFSSFIYKMNRHFKSQPRAIVITDTYLYRLSPDEKFKTKKDPILIKDINSATITDDPEYQIVVLNIKNFETDLVFYIQSSDNTVDKVPELLSNIYRSTINETQKLQVNVLKIPRCLVENKQKSIMIRKNAKAIKFEKSGDSINLLLPISS